MKKFSDGFVVSKWKASVKLAHECLNATNNGLPDSADVLRLATALLTTDLATGGSQTSNKHGGADAEQESMLSSAYESGSAQSVRPSR